MNTSILRERRESRPPLLRSTRWRRRLAATSAMLAAAVLLGACGKSDEPVAQSAPADPDPAPRVIRLQPRDPNLSVIHAWYEGMLPCLDCEGVRTELVLYEDRSLYLLHETFLYASGAESTFTARGAWRRERGAPGDAGATIYRLDGESRSGVHAFVRVDDETVRALDSLAKNAPDSSRTLTRIPVDNGG